MDQQPSTNSPNPLQKLRFAQVTANPGQPVTAPCPGCGQEITIDTPSPGSRLIKCPHCQAPVVMRINMPAIAPAKPAGPPAPMHIKVGEPARVQCPQCGKVHVITPTVPGRKTFNCVRCHTTVALVIEDPQVMPPKQADKQPSTTIALRDTDTQQAMGAITFGGFLGLNRKTVRLRVGQNTIGRADDEKPSSIAFNDSFMSRQSVLIDVMPGEDARAGFRFQFKVLNAANPVYVNKQQYAVGDSVFLNYGDTIKLGRTTMRFVKANTK